MPSRVPKKLRKCPGPDRLSYSTYELSLKTDIPETKIQEEISSGRLRSFKVGRSRRVSHDAILEYIVDREDETMSSA